MNDAGVWYIGVNGQQQGPLGTQQIADMIRGGQLTQTAYAYGQALPQWTPIAQVPVFAPLFTVQQPPPPPPPGPAPVMVADVIDFELFGGEMQFVEIVLDPGEAAIAGGGAAFYLDPGIKIEHGELTLYGNAAAERQKVAFAAASPGKIVAVDLRQHGNTLVCAAESFLCAAKGIAVTGAGMKKLDGQGLAFLHAGGTLVAKELRPGEVLRVDAACVAAFEARVGHDLQEIATLTGPGRIWLQSLPPARLARR